MSDIFIIGFWQNWQTSDQGTTSISLVWLEIHTHTRTHIYVHMNLYIYKYMYIYIQKHIYIYIYMNIYRAVQNCQKLYLSLKLKPVAQTSQNFILNYCKIFLISEFSIQSDLKWRAGSLLKTASRKMWYVGHRTSWYVWYTLWLANSCGKRVSGVVCHNFDEKRIYNWCTVDYTSCTFPCFQNFNCIS